ncbi:hypothetical protein Tco_1244102 [Tanacetum coccineum]
MLEKAKDFEVVAKKISHKPIDYGNLNSLIDDFGKRFSPQQEFSAEQEFWFPILNPNFEPSYTPPIIVDVSSVNLLRTNTSALEDGWNGVNGMYKQFLMQMESLVLFNSFQLGIAKKG